MTQTRAHKRFRNQRGVTLAESLIALALLGIAVSAIGDLIVQQVRLEGNNGTTTTAIALAEAELEDMRALHYDDMLSRSSTSVSGGTTYTLQTSVVADSPAPNMKTVSTTVTWAEALGARAYAMYAIYTNVTR